MAPKLRYTLQEDGSIRFDDTHHVYLVVLHPRKEKVALTFLAGAPPETVHSDKVELADMGHRMRFKVALEEAVERRGDIVIDSAAVRDELLEVAQWVAERRQERQAAIDKAASTSGSEAADDDDAEPWPEPVDGVALLDEIATILRRYVIADDSAIDTIALWALYTHAYDSFEVSPALVLQSAAERSGKTTVVSLMTHLVRRPMPSSNITAAAMFRSVDVRKPTLLIDEADAFMKSNEDLRCIVNSGYSKAMAFVDRCVSIGGTIIVGRFSTWCPKLIALIGHLPSTIEDRSIIIHMRRRTRGEHVERLREDRVGKFVPLRQRAARWALDAFTKLQASDPPIPDEITSSRAQDNWRVLLAVSDAAGGAWPRRARDAAVALYDDGQRESESFRIQLLRDLRSMFREREKKTWWFTDEILPELLKMEERPWPEYKHGKELTAKALSDLLRPFGIRPDKDEHGKRGYQVEDFNEAFSRYVAGDNPPNTPTSRK